LALAKILIASVATSLALAGVCDATTTSVSASASFEVPLTVVKESDISFGVLKAATAGTYVIDTSGTVTSSAGGIILGGTQSFGQITISGSATQMVSISTGTYVADHGVTPSAATCNYNGTPIANCDVGGAGLATPGIGKVLKLGVRIDADGTQLAGSMAAPTFVVTVIYG
jgi:hypothetical protein